MTATYVVDDGGLDCTAWGGSSFSTQSIGIHAYGCRPDIGQLEEDIGNAVRRGG